MEVFERANVQKGMNRRDRTRLGGEVNGMTTCCVGQYEQLLEILQQEDTLNAIRHVPRYIVPVVGHLIYLA